MKDDGRECAKDDMTTLVVGWLFTKHSKRFTSFLAFAMSSKAGNKTVV